MKKNPLPLFFFMILFVCFSANIKAQCDPTPVATLNYVSGSGASCVWNYSYNINYTGNSFKSFRMSVQCNSGSFTDITTCLPLVGPGTTSGTTNNFTCPCGTGNSITLQATYSTSNGSCGGGTTCLETVILSVLPVTIKGFDVKAKNGLPCLNWTVEEEMNIEKYLIEYSSDGSNYSVVGETNATNQSSYTFCDISNREGWFYRLKIQDISGISKYSQIIRFNNSSIVSKAKIYPNPAIEKLFIEWPADGSFNNALFTIYDGNGKKLITGRLLQNSIDISSLKNGTYFFEMQKNNGVISGQSFIKSGN